MKGVGRRRNKIDEGGGGGGGGGKLATPTHLEGPRVRFKCTFDQYPDETHTHTHTHMTVHYYVLRHVLSTPPPKLSYLFYFVILKHYYYYYNYQFIFFNFLTFINLHE